MSDEKKTYPRPSLTADVVAFVLAEEGLRVLFIRRAHDPFAGAWALPGGFCEPTETVAQAAARELQEETGLAGVALQELGCFSTPGRDPRGWVVTVAHLALLPADRAIEAKGADDASEAAWLSLTVLPDGSYQLHHQGAEVTALAFDHREILARAVGRLRERPDLALGLLGEPFTLADAERAFAAVLGARLDRDALRAQLVREALVREVTLPVRTDLADQGFLAGALRVERRWPLAAPAKPAK